MRRWRRQHQPSGQGLAAWNVTDGTTRRHRHVGIAVVTGDRLDGAMEQDFVVDADRPEFGQQALSLAERVAEQQ